MNEPNPHAWHLTDLERVPKAGVEVFTTFCCGGGSSLGYKLAGFDVVAANDIDPEMAWHYQANLKPRKFFLEPIRALLEEDLSEWQGIDILDGSPPCSTFSMSGNREEDWGRKKMFREGQAAQVLDDLFFDYLDLVAKLRPKVAIAENVKGLILGAAKGYTKLIFQRLKGLGYRPQLFLINAADCGVPQVRERVFFVAAREDLGFPELALRPARKWVTVGEACGDFDEGPLRKPSPNDGTWWPRCRPLESYAQAKERWGNPSKSCFNQIRLSATDPSPTLTAQSNVLKHWFYPRPLTWREYQRIGTFPEDYQVKNEALGKYLVGMSVPPKMMQAVAEAVRDQWFRPAGREVRDERAA